MTTCCRTSDIKSSVYNQKGESYFEQLAAYNRMSAHLRRVLLAKSRVDSRNESYMLKKRSISAGKVKFIPSPPQEFIDRVAYDTEHHPLVKNSQKIYSSGLSFHSARPGSFTKRNSKNYDKNQELEEENNDEEIEGCYGGKCNEYSVNSSNRSVVNVSDEIKYSKFLYDITQEIVQNGYYKDEELRSVFQKHIQRNSDTLDKLISSKISVVDKIAKSNKMMYELYQLKLSLNIVDHYDEDEEERIEKFIKSQKYLSVSPLKPPTPPKILDENKMTDKLMNPEELKEAYSKSPHSGRNTVVLVDANPELLITERDVLATLMEMNIDPDQAHRVYKRLLKRSKDLHTLQMVHARRKDAGISPIASSTRTQGFRSRSTQPNDYHQHQLHTQYQYDIRCGETSKRDFNGSQIQLFTSTDDSLKIQPPLCFCSKKNLSTVQNDGSKTKAKECFCKSRLRNKSPCEILSSISAKKKQMEKMINQTKLNPKRCYCPKKEFKDSRNKIESNKSAPEVKVKIKDNKNSRKINLREEESIKFKQRTKRFELSSRESVDKDVEVKNSQEESGTDDSSASRVTRLSFPAVRGPGEGGLDVTSKLSLDMEKSGTKEIKSSVTADGSTGREFQLSPSNYDSNNQDTDQESIAESYSDVEDSSEVKDKDDIKIEAQFFRDDARRELLINKEVPELESKQSRKRQICSSHTNYNSKRMHTQVQIQDSHLHGCATVCPNLPQKKINTLCKSCEMSVKKLYY
ncbi:GSCOCG00005953001-RA-CDS [Cotesia congregata]|nr:GSCOCG00005953001-RA-CDS [Cotesia congregata]